MQKNLNRKKNDCFYSLVALCPAEEKAHSRHAKAFKAAGCLLYVANALRMALREKLVGIANDAFFLGFRTQGTLIAIENRGHGKLALQEIFAHKPCSCVSLAETCQLLAGKVAWKGSVVVSQHLAASDAVEKIRKVAKAADARGIAATDADVVNPSSCLYKADIEVQFWMSATDVEGFFAHLTTVVDKEVAKGIILGVENVNKGVVMHFVVIFRCKDMKKV